jgi:hypothetical protein
MKIFTNVAPFVIALCKIVVEPHLTFGSAPTATLRYWGKVMPLWQRYAIASHHIKKKEKEILEKKV